MIELMKEWRASGWTLRRVAEELNAAGTPIKIGMGRWHAQTVKGILENDLPPGKCSDPAYQPVTAWVRKKTYQAVRERLLKESRGEFSVLVEELLQTWLGAQTEMKSQFPQAGGHPNIFILRMPTSPREGNEGEEGLLD